MNYTLREKPEFQQDSEGPERLHKRELDKPLRINSLNILSCPCSLPVTTNLHPTYLLILFPCLLSSSSKFHGVKFVLLGNNTSVGGEEEECFITHLGKGDVFGSLNHSFLCG